MITILSVTVVEVLVQGKWHFLLKREHGESEIWVKRMKERLKELRKCWRLLLRPVPKTVGAVLFWKYGLVANGLYFTERFETICAAALVLVVSVIYGLIYSKVMEIAFVRLQRLRKACRMPDWLQSSGAEVLSQQEKVIRLSNALYEYVLLKDDNLPPPLRALVIVPSLILVGLIMSIKYPDVPCGVCGVATITYLLSMFYTVLIEIDRAFSGLYRTKIPKLWKGLNVKAIRRHWRELEQDWFKQHTSEWSPQLTEGGNAEHDDDDELGGSDSGFIWCTFTRLKSKFLKPPQT